MNTKFSDDAGKLKLADWFVNANARIDGLPADQYRQLELFQCHH